MTECLLQCEQYVFTISSKMFVIFLYRFFLVAKLYYAYAIFATFLLQFYVPMDFLEPPLNRAINKLKERFCGQLVFQFPDYHKILNTAFLLVFRTLIVLIIGALIIIIIADHDAYL